jgi:hypothetical protein
MPSLSTLVDNFNAPGLGPEWGNSYGGTAVVAGRARVPCTTGYAGCQTAYAWTLAGATLYVQVPTTPSATGATVEAYAAVMVQGTVEGTRVGFSINKVSGMLRMVSETGYWDDNAVEVTYNATTHLFLRLREDGTNLYWDTSPDGTTWTNRRTLATPAWITADVDACALDMSSHRDAGTADYAEFDLVNTLSNGAVYTGTGTGSAQSAATATGKRTAVGASNGTAQSAAGATGTAIYRGTAAGSAQSNASVTSATDEFPEVAALAAGDLDLVIEQGVTFVQTYVCNTEDPNFTWAGWSARAQIRSSASASGELYLDLTPYLTVDGASVRLAIPATQTATLDKDGRWDLEMVMGATVVRILQGRMIVSPEVTR